MNVMYYIGFTYMVVHLSFVSFKKGEQLRIKFQTEIYPMYKHAFIGRWELSLLKMKYTITSPFRKKSKLFLNEIDKPFEHEFNKNLVAELATERHSHEIFKDVEEIYKFKKNREFQNFNFDENAKLSNKIQFMEKRKEISSFMRMNIFKVLFKQYSDGAMAEEDKEKYEPLFVAQDLIKSDGETKEIDSLKDALNKDSNQDLDIDEELKDVQVSVRKVGKMNAGRFDSGKK